MHAYAHNRKLFKMLDFRISFFFPLLLVSLVLGCCYKLLENPVFVREKTGLDQTIHLMGVLIHRYNMGLSECILEYSRV